MTQLPFQLVAPAGQSWPVTLSAHSYFALGIEAAVGEIPEIEIEDGSICTVMSKSLPFHVVVKHGQRVPIYRTKIRYKSGEIVDYFRVPLTAGDDPKMRGFARDPQPARDFAEEVALQRFEDGKNRMPDEALGLFKGFEYLCDKLGELGYHPYFVFDDLLRAAKTLKQGMANMAGFGGNPPSLTSLAEKAVIEHDKTRVQNPTPVNDVVESFVKAAEENEHISESIFKGDRAASRRFAKEHGKGLISDRTLGDVKGFLLKQKSYAEAKVCLRAIRKVFAHAREKMRALPQGKTVADMASISLQDYPKAGRRWGQKVTIYTAADVKLIMLAALTDPEWEKWIVVLALWFFGGIHFAELTRLRWKDIKKTGRVVLDLDVTGSAHHPRTLILSSASFSWIRGPWESAIEKGLENELIMPKVPRKRKMRATKKAQAPYNRPKDAFDAVFNQILAKAGVTRQDNGMRHSFATHLYHFTHDIDYLGAQMGTSNLLVLAVYVEFDLDDPDEAISYFHIGHPDFGAFEEQPDWIPRGHHRTYEYGLERVSRLRPAKKKKFILG